MNTHAAFNSSITLACSADRFKRALRSRADGGHAPDLAHPQADQSIAGSATVAPPSCGQWLDRLPPEVQDLCLKQLDAREVTAFRQTCRGAFDLVNASRSDVFANRAINAFVQGMHDERAMPAAVAASLAAKVERLHVSELWFCGLPGANADQKALDRFSAEASAWTRGADLAALEGQAERLQWLLNKAGRVRHLWLDHRALGYAFASIDFWSVIVPPTVRRLGLAGESLQALGRLDGPLRHDLTRHLQACISPQLEELLLVEAFNDIDDQVTHAGLPLFLAPVRSLSLWQDVALPLGVIERLCASDGSALRHLTLSPRSPNNTLVLEESSVASLGHWSLPNLKRAHLRIQEDEDAGGLLALATNRWPSLVGLNLSLPCWEIDAQEVFLFEPEQWRSLFEGPAFAHLEELTLANVENVQGLLAALCRKPGRALTKLHILLESYRVGFKIEDFLDGQASLFGVGALKELQSITMPLFDVDWATVFHLFSPLAKTLKYINLSLYLRRTDYEWPLAAIEANMAHLFSHRMPAEEYRWNVVWLQPQEPA